MLLLLSSILYLVAAVGLCGYAVLGYEVAANQCYRLSRTYSGPEKSNCTYPSLIEATVDDLEDGLRRGCFTSVDLVNVRLP